MDYCFEYTCCSILIREELMLRDLGVLIIGNERTPQDELTKILEPNIFPRVFYCHTNDKGETYFSVA